eukprot:372326-Rhodomonas_salina.1
MRAAEAEGILAVEPVATSGDGQDAELTGSANTRELDADPSADPRVVWRVNHADLVLRLRATRGHANVSRGDNVCGDKER